jgi:hypothetical protein
VSSNPITGEELQVKFLSDSGENALNYLKNGRPVETRTPGLYRVKSSDDLASDEEK